MADTRRALLQRADAHYQRYVSHRYADDDVLRRRQHTMSPLLMLKHACRAAAARVIIRCFRVCCVP